MMNGHKYYHVLLVAKQQMNDDLIIVYVNCKNNHNKTMSVNFSVFFVLFFYEKPENLFPCRLALLGDAVVLDFFRINRNSFIRLANISTCFNMAFKRVFAIFLHE